MRHADILEGAFIGLGAAVLGVAILSVWRTEPHPKLAEIAPPQVTLHGTTGLTEVEVGGSLSLSASVRWPWSHLQPPELTWTVDGPEGSVVVGHGERVTWTPHSPGPVRLHVEARAGDWSGFADRRFHVLAAGSLPDDPVAHGLELVASRRRPARGRAELGWRLLARDGELITDAMGHAMLLGAAAVGAVASDHGLSTAACELPELAVFRVPLQVLNQAAHVRHLRRQVPEGRTLLGVYDPTGPTDRIYLAEGAPLVPTTAHELAHLYFQRCEGWAEVLAYPGEFAQASERFAEDVESATIRVRGDVTYRAAR